jgi:hypothetical protein
VVGGCVHRTGQPTRRWLRWEFLLLHTVFGTSAQSMRYVSVSPPTSSFYPLLPTTIVAVFFINFPCLSLTNVLLLLDSNGWCSQIDQYLNAGAFAFLMQTVLTRLLYRFSGRRSIRTKRRNIRYRCLFPGILYVSFLASNLRALVDIVVQRDNIFVLSVELVIELGKVDLSPRLQWWTLRRGGQRYSPFQQSGYPLLNKLID